MMTPFPAESRSRWRRLDVPGVEEARVSRVTGGWELGGALEVEEEGVAARLRYRIACDWAWRTRSAVVDGSADGRKVRIDLSADGAGNWVVDGVARPELAGALDVDLGFTPATNSLPIRRMGLAVGEARDVRTAWVRFPELRVEALEQTYLREGERAYRYRALVDGEVFSARLDVDEFGRVVEYEGLWRAEG
ncbi:MAG TPA: putative glycolipid-binding domain-containing protein [Tepidisphaeraceae bacterium]|nr:putative glycolipid-binding domain-containing protein [Tepidisphaeraceae bacterium]